MGERSVGVAMDVVFTYEPKEDFRVELKREFPDQQFHFCKNVKEAWEILAEAQVAVTMGEDLTPEILENCQQLKWIMVTSAGLEKMPFDSIRERGIMVTNARGIHKIPMAEFTLGLMLQHAKKFPVIGEQEKEKTWSRRIGSAELHDHVLLVLGAGAIGGEVARLSKAFGMKVIGINSSGEAKDHFDEMYTFEGMDKVLGSADYIVSVLPSTKETRSLLTIDHFKAMKESAAFINIGRGDLVEEEVLLRAAGDHLVEKIYLDVFKDEPLPADHPFWEEESITITPHVSSITEHYMPRALSIFKTNLLAYHNGEELINIIDTERGY